MGCLNVEHSNLCLVIVWPTKRDPMIELLIGIHFVSLLIADHVLNAPPDVDYESMQMMGLVCTVD